VEYIYWIDWTNTQGSTAMGDCGLNCDFNAGVIDSWHRQTYKERDLAQKNDKGYQKTMAPIRKAHVCHVCAKYPGDAEYRFGNWTEGRFVCFGCL